VASSTKPSVEGDPPCDSYEGASLLIAFSLLTSAATVSAECAWVVWEMSQIQNPSNPELATRVYNIMGARGTEDGCRDMSKKMNEMKNPRVVMYYCLPDTVDPRGPKAR